MAGKLRHIAVGNNTYDLQGGNLRIFYGTCSTGAAAQTKVVNIAEVSVLETGDVFYIKMTNAQTYNGVPKLQINSLAAKNITRTGSVNAARYEWNAGEILEFLYDGTSMVLVDGAIANTTYYGLTKLSSAVNSSSEDIAATPKAVKAAYDKATTSMSGATATQPGAAGIVPQPVAGDQVKFLRGDGKWVENSGSVLTVNGVSPDISKNVQIDADDIGQSAITETGVDTVNDALAHQATKITNLGPVNNLTSDSTTAALSAAQGKALNERLSNLETPQSTYYVSLATVTGAVGDGSISICKIGRLAFMVMNFILSSSMPHGILLTVPDSLRPYAGFTFGTFCAQGINSVPGYFELNSDGQLICYDSPTTDIWCNFCTMYITAN